MRHTGPWWKPSSLYSLTGWKRLESWIKRIDALNNKVWAFVCSPTIDCRYNSKKMNMKCLSGCECARVCTSCLRCPFSPRLITITNVGEGRRSTTVSPAPNNGLPSLKTVDL